MKISKRKDAGSPIQYGKSNTTEGGGPFRIRAGTVDQVGTAPNRSFLTNGMRERKVWTNPGQGNGAREN